MYFVLLHPQNTEVTHPQNLGCPALFKLPATQYWFNNKQEKKFESSKTEVKLSNYDSAALHSGANFKNIFLITAWMNEVNYLLPT